MFGNKKTVSASSDDDFQLTTRSMKSDLEGGSDNLIKEEVKEIKTTPLKMPEKKATPTTEDLNKSPNKSMDFPQKKKSSSSEIKEKELKLPTDLPTTKKPLENIIANNSIKQRPQSQQEKTHADDFFPEEANQKESFPKNPINLSKKESPKRSLEDQLKQNNNITLKPELKNSSTNTTNYLKNESTKKDYDEFFKDKIKQSPEMETERKSSSSSTILIIVLVIVLVIAIASGAYYYFFVIKKPAEPIEPPIVVEPPTSFPVDPIQPPAAEEVLPKALEEAITIMPTTGKNIKTTLFDPQNPDNLTPGFYSIKNIEGESISTQDISSLFNIQLPETVNMASQESWIYYDNSTSTPGISLLIKINPEDKLAIKQSVTASEENLFNLLSGLYGTPVNQYLTGEVIVFKDSSSNPGFRYYNIETAPTPTSLDWGITNDDNILVFATSKEMATTISNQLSIDNENDYIINKSSTENNMEAEMEDNDTDLQNDDFDTNESTDLPI